MEGGAAMVAGDIGIRAVPEEKFRGVQAAFADGENKGMLVSLAIGRSAARKQQFDALIKLLQDGAAQRGKAVTGAALGIGAGVKRGDHGRQIFGQDEFIVRVLQRERGEAGMAGSKDAQDENDCNHKNNSRKPHKAIL